jgi:two-component system phosphate regulon response regulator PhoB
MSTAQKLLIVEDSGDVRRLLRLALGYGMYRMYETDTGEEALTMIETLRPDVVLLDVMLPGRLNGFDVCRAVKEDRNLRSTFVVLLTARGQKGDLELGKAAMADAHVVKPFSVARLIEIIECRPGKGTMQIDAARKVIDIR